MFKTMNVWEALESEEGIKLLSKTEEFIRQHMTIVDEPDLEDYFSMSGIRIQERQAELETDAAAEREYIAAEFVRMADNLGCLEELKEIVRRK